MCKLEMMTEDERKKRMELNELFNVVVDEFERENVREYAEVEARNLREEVDRLKEKVEEVRKEVSVRPKNRGVGCTSENGIGQARLNNVRARSEQGT